MLSRPIVWRHPFIFYLGHLPAFAWNQICAGVLNWKPINPYFNDIFSRGIDPDVDNGRCHAHPKTPQQWPTISEVLRYRDQVRAAVLRSFEAVWAQPSNGLMVDNGGVYRMVLEHEYMHHETLLYMIQQMPFNDKKRPADSGDYRFAAEPRCREIDIPEGTARLGAAFNRLDFGWDNEFPTTHAYVPAFRIDTLPVTNGRFLEFVSAGGYDDRALWSGEDWFWRENSGTGCPTFWLKKGGRWFYRTLFDLLPLDQVLSWPVYVSLAEARAYANWCGKRLPTEAEFHRAAYGAAADGSHVRKIPDTTPGGNFDFANWSPTPVGFEPDRDHGFGLNDIIGNGWEWTETRFAPFPGFSAYLPNYREYSADFFDGKHYVLKGASWATAADLVRPSFRNWYQAHYPYVFAKFRCVSR